MYILHAFTLVVLRTTVTTPADVFRDQLGAEFPNTVISQLVLPKPVAPQPGTEPLTPQTTGGTTAGSCACACSHRCEADKLEKRTEITQGNEDSSPLLDQEPRLGDPVRDIHRGENVLETHQQFTEVSSRGDNERNQVSYNVCLCECVHMLSG